MALPDIHQNSFINELSAGDPRDGRSVEGAKMNAPNPPPAYEGSSKVYDDVVHSDASLPC